MTNSIFDKTDKGREEIATRKHHLTPRLRTLLLLVDGKHSTQDLLRQVTGLGLGEQNLTELLRDGFIQAVAATTSQTPASAPAPVEQAARQATPAAPAMSPSSSVPTLPEGQTQFEAIYHFYTETIKSTIGLRGYGLQLKVEKAASIEEFRELRRPYLEAVLKAKGNEMARSLKGRLDELLYYGETVPPQTTIIGMNAATAAESE
jgi:hypothetical protein